MTTTKTWMGATTIAALLLAVSCAAPDEGLSASERTSPLTARRQQLTSQHPLPPGATFFDNHNRLQVGNEISDWSGTVHTKIWVCFNGPLAAHPVVQCSVDSGYVLIGGGAAAMTSGPGALLTASYPVDPMMMTTWEGRSKDHGALDPHALAVYAVGLRLSGVSRGTVLSQIWIGQMTQGPAHFPEASTPGPEEFPLITGGGVIDWQEAGNMLTAVLPNASVGKDHGWEDPSTITHYGIGLNPSVPGFGTLEVGVVAKSVSGSGALTADTTLGQGWVPAGWMALSTGFNPGRMLTRMGPVDFATNFSYSAGSKDHLWPADGTLTGITRTLRRQP
jgi:hypothetical protein